LITISQRLDQVKVMSPEINKENLEEIEQIEGSLATQNEKDSFMHTVLECDRETIDYGKLLNEAISQNVSSFVPDNIFEKLVKDYSLTKSLLGEGMIRALAGYDPNYVEKNINIPEFKRIVEKNIHENIEEMKERGVLDKDGTVTEKGLEVASVSLYIDELDNLVSSGYIGEKINKKHSVYGGKDDIKKFKKDRYRDIALRKTISRAVRRGRNNIIADDLLAFKRVSKGQINIIYAIDSSGSMKGEKILASKKAGVALAYKATESKDKVGVITFGTDVRSFIAPTHDFIRILNEIARIRPGHETNMASTIMKSIELFPGDDITKHLIILTDASPTVGDDPHRETLDAVSTAKNQGISTSIVGINLDEDGAKFAEEMTRLGGGRLYIVKDLEKLNKIILEEYRKS